MSVCHSWRHCATRIHPQPPIRSTSTSLRRRVAVAIDEGRRTTHSAIAKEIAREEARAASTATATGRGPLGLLEGRGGAPVSASGGEKEGRRAAPKGGEEGKGNREGKGGGQAEGVPPWIQLARELVEVRGCGEALRGQAWRGDQWAATAVRTDGSLHAFIRFRP